MENKLLRLLRQTLAFHSAFVTVYALPTFIRDTSYGISAKRVLLLLPAAFFISLANMLLRSRRSLPTRVISHFLLCSFSFLLFIVIPVGGTGKQNLMVETIFIVLYLITALCVGLVGKRLSNAKKAANEQKTQ